ncbi:chitin synthase D [Aspergillus luchuensis]|uniref:chitin synthase n=1 Tax=Aspergillus kawachii TaxID=1069201 RepID=A0A146FRN8_ASPKA|nr:chitin synthase D [Aspergillus luchuensis]
MAEEPSSKLLAAWPTRDIIYISILGPLLLAALLEWFLFLAAFIYCLIKVYQKADHWSIRVLAVIMALLITLCRFVIHSLGRTKRVKEALDDRTAPKTVIVMPVYKEDPLVLIKAIDSVVNSDYPSYCIHVFLSYDGCNIDEPYLHVIDHLGIPISLESYPQSIDVTYHGARITVSRFKHGGKRHCQKQTFRLIDKDMEYIHGQLVERTVESGCGAVTCLPGALTILRFSAFRKMARYYFADKAEQCEDLFDYGKCHLGEDRWLTHLFMIGAIERYQIQMCTSAFCKTEAVQTFCSLLKQRRRWFLGYITNEVCMLTDVRLWKRYPLLCLVRFMQNTIRTTALLFFILVISIITTSSKIKNLPVGFIAVSLGLNYILMVYFGIRLKRFKAWLYPLMFILNPFFNWLYIVYGIFTAGQRTWGGPRADAAKADEHTTPEEAVEKARVQGDELNVQVDTFRTKIEEKGVPIRPSSKVNGRLSFAPQLPDRYYDYQGALGTSLAKYLTPLPDVPRIGLHPHCSSDSVATSDSGGNSISLPQNVESLMSAGERARLSISRPAQEDTGLLHTREADGGEHGLYVQSNEDPVDNRAYELHTIESESNVPSGKPQVSSSVPQSMIQQSRAVPGSQPHGHLPQPRYTKRPSRIPRQKKGHMQPEQMV